MSDDLSYSPHLPAMRHALETASAPRPANLSAIIGRIEEAVEEETAGIRAGPGFDIKASNERKSRYLYELNRAMKNVGDMQFLRQHGDALGRLREKLARNEAAIRAHMSAVGEVAALLQDVIQRSEADGTYSAGEFGWAR